MYLVYDTLEELFVIIVRELNRDFSPPTAGAPCVITAVHFHYAKAILTIRENQAGRPSAGGLPRAAFRGYQEVPCRYPIQLLGSLSL